MSKQPCTASVTGASWYRCEIERLVDQVYAFLWEKRGFDMMFTIADGRCAFDCMLTHMISLALGVILVCVAGPPWVGCYQLEVGWREGCELMPMQSQFNSFCVVGGRAGRLKGNFG